MSLNAYRSAMRIAETPRAAEHRLMREITGELAAAIDQGASGAALMPALHRNREMWGVFSAACAAPGNALPAELRAGIIALGQWVDRHSSAVMQGRESAADLIEVNRTMIEALDPGHRGQRGQPGSAPQASSSTSQ